MENILTRLIEPSGALLGQLAARPEIIAALVSLSLFILIASVLGMLRFGSTITRRTTEIGDGTVAGRGSYRSLGYAEQSKVDRIAARASRLLDPKDEKQASNIKLQLIRAGFFSPYAITVYYAIRVLFAVAMPILLLVVLSLANLHPPTNLLLFQAGGASVVGLIIPGVLLDWWRNKTRDGYRHAFPDMMDLLVVCVEAGSSLQAALDRVGQEIGHTNAGLGANVRIVNLELRAGRDLNSALLSLSNRLGVEEVRSLALLMRQSEELGTSLAATLRVFSDEMRDKRLMLAEARANSLPVKMVVPLGMFIFPVILLVIMTPLVIRINHAFS